MKTRVLAGLLGFLLGAGIAAAADDSLQKVIDNGVLRVGAEPGTPPMLYKNGPRYDGFDWSIANALAKRIPVESVVIVGGKYSELPGRLIEGKFDVIVSGYTADDSIAGVEWSESYLDYGLCLIVRKGSSIRSIRDLSGKVVGIFNDPAAEEEVRRLVKGYKDLQKFEDGYFELLDEGKLDAFIYDFPYAQEEIKPFGGRLEIVEFNLTSSSYNVGVRKGASSLLNVVNAAIRELRNSDEYRQIVRKYLGGMTPPKITEVRTGEKVYVVKRGDTLSAIARDHLGKVSRWPELWEANKGRIANPNLIEIGWELLLPQK